MLMLLEGQPLGEEPFFRHQQSQMLQHYYRDKEPAVGFKPLFLLNDILRYWRTLCLNYEQTRHDKSRKWRKKNTNLKFSRMVTVFGTVLPLICLNQDQLGPGESFWTLSPLERLATGLDGLGDAKLAEHWSDFLESYEQFLQWKEDPEIELRLKQMKPEIDRRSEIVATFLYDALHHEKIQPELRRFLVL